MKLSHFYIICLLLIAIILSCKKDDAIDPDKDLQCSSTGVIITNKVIKSDSIILEWSKIEGIKEYEITIDQIESNPKTRKTADTKLVLTGLTSDTEYFISIQSICISGKYSTFKTKETIKTSKACEQKVNNFKVESLQDNEVVLSWTKTSQVEFYVVQLFDAENGVFISDYKGNENKATFSDLPSGKSYLADIKSGCDAGGLISSLSTRIEFKTKDKIINDPISSLTVPCKLSGCDAIYEDNLLSAVLKGPSKSSIPITLFLNQDCNGYYFKFYDVKDSLNYSDFVIYSKKNVDGSYSTYYKISDCDKYKNSPKLINGSLKHYFNQNLFYTTEIIGNKIKISQSSNCHSRYKVVNN